MKRVIAMMLALLLCLATMAACAPAAEPEPAPEPAQSEDTAEPTPAPEPSTTEGMTTYMELDGYQPQKDSYKLFFSYVLVHPWWASVEIGMQAAADQLAAQGIEVEFEYVAPQTPDGGDQVQRVEAAAGQGYDAIGIDVTEEATITSTINELVASGIPVMTFGGSDAPSSDRYVYVGNSNAKRDGAQLAQELVDALGGAGNVAVLGGTPGNPVHELRLEGMNEVFAEYPDIVVLDTQFESDDLAKAVQISESYIQRFPELDAIYCNNMTNPIGAADAVKKAERDDIVIVGMDHDQRTLEEVRDGTILVTGVQDCYAMGFRAIETAIKLADGERPGGEWIENDIMDQDTNFVYADRAQEFIDLLY